MEITSILTSIKQMLGIGQDDLSFDSELVIYINGALMVANQLGIGPTGYMIEDKSNEWGEFFLGRTDLELVKTMVYLRVRLLFDPPQNSFAVAAIKEQIQEYDWRLSISSPPVAPI